MIEHVVFMMLRDESTGSRQWIKLTDTCSQNCAIQVLKAIFRVLCPFHHRQFAREIDYSWDDYIHFDDDIHYFLMTFGWLDESGKIACQECHPMPKGNLVWVYFGLTTWKDWEEILQSKQKEG